MKVAVDVSPPGGFVISMVYGWGVTVNEDSESQLANSAVAGDNARQRALNERIRKAFKGGFHDLTCKHGGNVRMPARRHVKSKDAPQ